MSSNWGYMTIRFLHANLMYRILLPVQHMNVSLYANFVHPVHKQADDNVYHHKVPWWHCVPMMQLLEKKKNIYIVMSTSWYQEGAVTFYRSFFIQAVTGYKGWKLSLYPCFNEVEREVYWFHLVRLSVCGLNRVRSVFSLIFAGSVPYLPQKMCSMYKLCQTSKIWNFGKFLKFVIFTLSSLDLGSNVNQENGYSWCRGVGGGGILRTQVF